MSRPHTDETQAGEAFWRFSLALYARPLVADALLALQERGGLDPNLALFGLWLGTSRDHRLTAAELVAARTAAAPISGGVVSPLRQLRRQLKGAADRDVAALRQRIAGLELAAERRVQYRLAAYAARMLNGQSGNASGRRDAAAANLALCLGAESGSPEIRVLLAALAALTRTGRQGDSRDATP